MLRGNDMFMLLSGYWPFLQLDQQHLGPQMDLLDLLDLLDRLLLVDLADQLLPKIHQYGTIAFMHLLDRLPTITWR